MNTVEKGAQCFIWPEYRAERYPSDYDKVRAISSLSSDRAGGGYRITYEAIDWLSYQVSNDQTRAKLTTMLINMRQQGDGYPLVTTDVVDTAISKQPLPIYERAERLLRYYAQYPLGEQVSANQSTEQGEAALAWSESTTGDELDSFIKYLTQRGWMEELRLGSPARVYRVTVDGHSQVADLITNTDSSQCFVAMWFSDSMNDAYEQGIKPAIEAAGYNPTRIDKKDDNLNKIDDQIIAEIRRSRFLVADFTHGNDGARGGVYYEAGFAHGLNIPVIFMCREDKLEELHFDTRQYPHIVWEEPNDLCGQLQQRILAAIGEGPNLAISDKQS